MNIASLFTHYTAVAKVGLPVLGSLGVINEVISRMPNKCRGIMDAVGIGFKYAFQNEAQFSQLAKTLVPQTPTVVAVETAADTLAKSPLAPATPS